MIVKCKENKYLYVQDLKIRFSNGVAEVTDEAAIEKLKAMKGYTFEFDEPKQPVQPPDDTPKQPVQPPDDTPKQPVQPPDDTPKQPAQPPKDGTKRAPKQ